MDLLQLLMQRFGGVGGDYEENFDNVIEKYTNKNFMIAKHDAILHSQENLPPDLDHCNMTTTTEIKFSKTVPLHSTNCITLKELLKSIDTPVTGKFLLCRSISPPYKLTALFAIVDDPDGKLGVRIALYNFVRNLSHRHPKDLYQYLPVGTMLAIMNPWFKKTTDGGLTIRCDNPAEVVILNRKMVEDIIGCRPWKGEIPTKYQRKELQAGSTAFDWKVCGNEHFSQKRFQDAIQAYTNGINDGKSSAKNKLDLLANRSAAYLALNKFKLGLIDAESVLLLDSAHIKCMFRKAKALFELAEYRNALNFLTSLSIDTLPSTHTQIISDLIVKAKSLIAQSETGDYPWVNICQNQFDDLAEFVGPVIVKNTSTKGRGLFATDAIKAGQLILASKAFARVVVDRSDGFFMNMCWNQKSDEKHLKDRSQTQLITEIVHILKENPEKCRELYNLYAGPEYNSHMEPIDDNHSYGIDVQRIEAICLYNQFGSGNVGLVSDNEKERSCGLYLSPSYINHSCVDGNSVWYWKKDFLFVSAFHDIAKDEEILISYVPPVKEKSQKALDKYGFLCDCRLCVRDRQDNSTVKIKRSNLISRLDAILNKYENGQHGKITDDDDRMMTMILKSLNDLRKDTPELNLSYADKLELVASVYLRNGEHLKSVRTLEQMYNLISDVPAFFLLTAKITNDIVGVYTGLGEMEKVKRWIPILKRNCVLAYGTWKVIEFTFPFTYNILQQIGISIIDM